MTAAVHARWGWLPDRTTHSFVTMTDWVAAGMAMAVASVAFERRGQTPRPLLVVARGAIAWSAAGGLLLLAARPFDVYSYLAHPGSAQPSAGTVVASNLLLGAFATAVLLPAVLGSGGLVRRLLAWRPLARIGLLAYGIYLWHFPPAAWLAGWHGPPDPIPGTAGGLGVEHLFGTRATALVLLVTTVAVSVVIASASYRWVELPFLRRKESASAHRSPAAPVAVETS